MNDFDQEMWHDFLVEAAENLQEFEPGLLLLEQHPDDSAMLNDCFRNMHSIKGAANYMGFIAIATLAHAIETLFDQARQGNRKLDQTSFDLIFRCVDRFKELLEDISKNQKETLTVDDLLDEINMLSEASSPATPEPAEAAEAVPEEETDEDQELMEIFAEEMKSLYEQLVRILESDNIDPSTLDLVLQDMERVTNYIGKEELYAEISKIRDSIAEISPEDMSEEMKRDLLKRIKDVLSGEIAMEGLQDIGEAFTEGPDVEEDVELYNIFLDFFKEVGSSLMHIPSDMDQQWMLDCQEAIVRLKASANYMDYMDIVHLLEEWEECMAEQLSGSVTFDRDVFTALREKLCDRLPELRDIFTLEEEAVSRAVEPAEAMESLEAGEFAETAQAKDIEDLDELDMALDSMFGDEELGEDFLTGGEAGASESEAVAGAESLEQEAGPSMKGELDSMAAGLAELADMGGFGSVPSEPSKAQAREQQVRISLDKVENLLEDVAELVVLRSSMSSSSELLKDIYGNWRDQRKLTVQELKPLKNVLLDFTESVAALDRVVQQLQDAVMNMRMLPVSSLFNRYPRMVRDLSRKLGKEVQLSMKGTETALDKQVLEQLADPLQHIIRNAVDHGIETAMERSAAGKTPEGHMFISASQEGGFVVITVSDDGKGLDRDQIVKKALAMGVISPEALREMNESQIWNLIFLPGITTAGSVSDISGRGVGLDVVKKNIEKIGGSVVVNSEKGKGTTFQLRIPLTLAIIKGLTVKVGGQAMVVPVSAVHEIFRVSADELSSVEGYEIISRRQETLPLIRLGKIFRGTRAPSDSEKFFAVRVRLGELDACLGVDALMGQQEVVIKPLSQYLMDQPGFAGATILGDGSIALILDLPAVLEKAKGFILKRQQILEQSALGLEEPEMPVYH